jgi:predicted ATPase
MKRGGAAMIVTVRERKPVTREEKLKGREAILAVLARAADDSEFLAQLAENPAEALSGYYTLTQEEVAALVSGDIKQIEGWVGKLDKRHATWLWCRLSQEKW